MSGLGHTRRCVACIGLMLILCFLLRGAPARADVYKWVDADGVVHFSDKPPQASQGELEIERQPDAPPSTYQPPDKPEPSRDAAGDSRSGERSPASKVKTQPKVVLYVTSWCKYCKKAQAFLNANRIPFEVYDIEKDAAAAARRRAIDPRPGVPLAVINGWVLLGFSETAYRKALDLNP